MVDPLATEGQMVPADGDINVIGQLNVVLPDIDGRASTAADREVATDSDTHVIFCGLIDVYADFAETDGVR